MQKKHCLLVMVFVLMLGAIGTSLPPAEASVRTDVRFYVWNAVAGSNIYGAVAPGLPIVVEVWIDAPNAWDNAPEGIVGWGLSVRVDPRALEVMSAMKIASPGGFLEDFLARYYLDIFYGFTTSFLVGPIDKDTGTILDVSEMIMGYETLADYGYGGAGGGPIKLCRFIFKSRSDVIPSVIDLFGIRPMIEMNAVYRTTDGVDHYVDLLDDGYYISSTPQIMYFDASPGWDPALPPIPPTLDWQELWPGNDWWSMNDWIDHDANNVLSELDQVFMVNTAVPLEQLWFYVEWVNTINPLTGDGGADLILVEKEMVPEFPLGIGLMMAIAPAIPIVYLWRTRKKVGKK